ncbi:pseudouridine synthase [Lasiosphaeria miniovina]|uniref:tRNA pseudouridine(55) synthase n=1 Tax=Lasiosphaeria miniovina TaxID=1954250 RepID=A0AA40E6X8_9PEZI|nr:pseudouridine synthase [Lasiosphaeria miniovina]KAK0727267.1 pseudouridine synthase [Lasiosphaeria miniovina]
MAKTNIVEGVFGINKPIGMSSAQVIRDCQNYFNPSELFAPLLKQERDTREKESHYQQKRRRNIKRQLQVKIGHGGTLDPLATGVLILGVGKGTKSLQGFLTCTKTYETVVLFGASTDTYDRVGRIIKKGKYDDITRAAVEKVLESFRGKYKQMPPLYSALKMDGKPLYEYAREGKPIPREIATRDVEVTEMELVEWYEPGTHNHRWPAEEAEQAEKNLVDSVWRVAKKQATSEDEPGKLTLKQEEEETKALAEYQSNKRQAEERVDGLVREDSQLPKRRKVEQANQPEPMMSGALGDLPPVSRGSNLVPPPPAPNTPPPWEGKGPPAARIRMTVTSGFYVRSLCHDLGEKLGCGAMMAELSRTRQGIFVLGGNNCLEYTDLTLGEAVWAPKVGSMMDLWNNRGTVTVPSASKPAEPSAKTEPAEPAPEPAKAEKAEEKLVEEKIVEEKLALKVENAAEEAALGVASASADAVVEILLEAEEPPKAEVA